MVNSGPWGALEEVFLVSCLSSVLVDPWVRRSATLPRAAHETAGGLRGLSACSADVAAACLARSKLMRLEIKDLIFRRRQKSTCGDGLRGQRLGFLGGFLLRSELSRLRVLGYLGIAGAISFPVEPRAPIVVPYDDVYQSASVVRDTVWRSLRPARDCMRKLRLWSVLAPGSSRVHFRRIGSALMTSRHFG